MFPSLETREPGRPAEPAPAPESSLTQAARAPPRGPMASCLPSRRSAHKPRIHTKNGCVAVAMTGGLGRLPYPARATRAIAAQPYEGLERAFERIAEWHDQRGPPPRYEVTEPCEEQV